MDEDEGFYIEQDPVDLTGVVTWSLLILSGSYLLYHVGWWAMRGFEVLR